MTQQIPEFLANYSNGLAYDVNGKVKFADNEDMKAWVTVGQVWQSKTGELLTIKKIYLDAWLGAWCAEYQSGAWNKLESVLRNGKLVG